MDASTCWVPSIVAIELAWLRGAGRKTVGVPQLQALVTAQPAFAVLPLDLAQAMAEHLCVLARTHDRPH
ncbi:MAG: hypothetical protein IT293_10975 [Deltaproteobacteria bacterium]|nr:hypothetical protein [Deltaproteobacteria bacterium]